MCVMSIPIRKPITAPSNSVYQKKSRKNPSRKSFCRGSAGKRRSSATMKTAQPAETISGWYQAKCDTLLNSFVTRSVGARVFALAAHEAQLVADGDLSGLDPLHAVAEGELDVADVRDQAAEAV